MQLKLRVNRRLVHLVVNHLIILNFIIDDMNILEPTHQTMKHHIIGSCNTVILENIVVHSVDGFDFQRIGIVFLNSPWTQHNAYSGRRKLVAISVHQWRHLWLHGPLVDQVSVLS